MQKGSDPTVLEECMIFGISAVPLQKPRLFCISILGVKVITGDWPDGQGIIDPYIHASRSVLWPGLSCSNHHISYNLAEAGHSIKSRQLYLLRQTP